MATPLPAVPAPPPGPTPDATPPLESRDPLADRAHAAALDATLSRGRAALFDATLDRPIPSRMQPPSTEAPASPGAARRRWWTSLTLPPGGNDNIAVLEQLAGPFGLAVFPCLHACRLLDFCDNNV